IRFDPPGDPPGGEILTAPQRTIHSRGALMVATGAENPFSDHILAIAERIVPRHSSMAGTGLDSSPSNSSESGPEKPIFFRVARALTTSSCPFPTTTSLPC